MIHQHLNEEDVQSFAMREPGASDAHWLDCSSCRERVEAYREVYRSIAAMDPEAAGFDLAAVVMAQLPERGLSKQSAGRPMVAMPIWIGSVAFLAVLVGISATLRGYFSVLGNAVTWLVLVTVPGIALWLLIDAIQDHRRKLRSIGLS